MKKSNPILGITLEGFQVFDKPTYIPLDRLTLIYGPNSAGKSAVQDALGLYNQLLNVEQSAQNGKDELRRKNLYKSKYGLYDEDLPELVERHWRRLGDSSDVRVAKMSIAVTHATAASIESTVARELQRKLLGKPAYSHPIQLENRWTFLRHEDEALDFLFDLLIESELLVSQAETGLRVNLLHPILRNIEKKVDFATVASTYPNEVSFEDGYFKIHEGIFGFHPSGRGVYEKGDRWLDYFSANPARSDQSHVLLHAAVAEIGLFVGHFLSALNDSLLGFVFNNQLNFMPITVQASRKVPTRSDMTFFEPGNPDDPLQNHWNTGDAVYKSLATSLTSTEHQNLAANVNRALSDHLFLNQGYRLDCDLRVLLSKADSKAAIAGEKIYLKESGHLVELFLRDGQGRRHLFEDVGSGIGYVLPVLCAVFSSPGIANPCFIQQPELHLHPALQAAMGDVFLEASASGKQILAETHSEHMLLRILKRIRQTHLLANIAPELKINAEDVCVLYFDPSQDGTTIVKRLRITEDGEFMDRWPRGFFGERDLELFDE